jgi:hypothetical protein
VRIDDIVAAMGPRVPAADASRKEFRLGVYLLHEDGRPPRTDLVQRAQAVTTATAEYFAAATGGRMRVVPTLDPDANLPPVPAGALAPLTLTVGLAVQVESRHPSCRSACRRRPCRTGGSSPNAHELVGALVTVEGVVVHVADEHVVEHRAADALDVHEHVAGCVAARGVRHVGGRSVRVNFRGASLLAQRAPQAVHYWL